MAENKKVSELDAAPALTGDELLHVVQGGNSRQTTVAEVAAHGTVDTFSDLASLTDSDIDVGDYAQVTETGAVYERAADAASDEHLDYSGSGGVKWYVLPTGEGYVFSHFGATGGSEVDDALDAALSGIPSGGTLIVDAPVGGSEYILDRFHRRTSSITIIGKPGHEFKLKDQSTCYHDTSETTYRDLFGFWASDCWVYHLNLDMNSYGNYTEGGGVKTYAHTDNRVNGIVFNGSSSGGAYTNVGAVGCVVKRPVWIAIGVVGPMLSGDGDYGYADAFGVDGFTLAENRIENGGHVSIIYMGAGVRNGAVRDNKGRDLLYDWIRAYRQVLNVDVMDNDYLLSDGAVDHTRFVDDDAANKTYRQGIRIGHSSSATGSCKDIRVLRNKLRIHDNGLDADTEAAPIRVATDCPNIQVDDNYVYPNNMANGLNFEGPGENLRARENVVDCDDLTTSGVRFTGSSAGADIGGNDIRNAKTQSFDISGVSGALFDGNILKKGSTTTQAFNFAGSATGNTVRETEIDGFDLSELCDATAIVNNTILHTETTTHTLSGESLTVDLTGPITLVDVDLSGMVAASAGTLNIKFQDSTPADITGAISFHRGTKTASADAETVSRNTGQDSAPICAVGTASSTSAGGHLTLHADSSRISGFARMVARSSGNVAADDVSFALNNSGAETAILHGSAGLLSGRVVVNRHVG